MFETTTVNYTTVNYNLAIYSFRVTENFGEVT